MSDSVNIDLTQYKDRVGARVTPGQYRVQVSDAEVTKAGSGNDMVTLWLRIMGGEFDGQEILDRLVQTPNSLFRTVNFMQAIGLPTPKRRIQLNLRQVIGQVLDVVVDDGDPYLGKVKSEVRDYIRVHRGEAEGGGQTDLDALDGLEEFTKSAQGEEPVPDQVDLSTLDQL